MAYRLLPDTYRINIRVEIYLTILVFQVVANRGAAASEVHLPAINLSI